jgi:hypothetical protein
VYAFITTMPKDDDNDTTCTVNTLYSEKKGVRQKIEEPNENPRFGIFFLSLILTLLRRPRGPKTVGAYTLG